MKQEAEGNYVVGTGSFSSQENMQKMFPGLIPREEGTKALTFSLFSLFSTPTYICHLGVEKREKREKVRALVPSS